MEISPAGHIKRFDLRGDLLQGIEDGTPLLVRGIVRTRLHRGSTPDNPSPFPPQWTIWLEVTELQKLDHLRDVLREPAP